MTIWLTHIQKRIDTNAKLIALLVNILKHCKNMALNMQKTVFSLFYFKLRNTEEAKAPKDYATTPCNSYKWEKLTGEHDEWN